MSAPSLPRLIPQVRRLSSRSRRRRSRICQSTTEIQQLANLIPGAAPSPSYDPTKRLYGGVVSGGATARSSCISVDGGNFNDNIVGGPVGLVPEDAIQEFRVITNQFSAEYGHSSGPFINVVTKSGTNTVHGSGFLLSRYQFLISRHPHRSSSRTSVAARKKIAAAQRARWAKFTAKKSSRYARFVFISL